MNRVELILATDAIRERAIRWIKAAPKDTRVSFKKARRTLDQNAKMHAMLSDIAKQHRWCGDVLSKDDWKVIFLQALDGETRTVMNLAGDGFISLGRSSSDLSVAEMSDLIELLYMWGADPKHPVTWSEPDRWHAQLSSAARSPGRPTSAPEAAAVPQKAMSDA